MRVVIDSVDTSDDDDGPTEMARTLERLAFTVATLISSNSNSPEHNVRVLNDFERTVRGNIWLQSSSRRNDAGP
jgi:hypothetical protein